LGTCIESGESFGVLLIKEGVEVGGPAAPYEIGTEAVILNHEILEDGRILLLAREKRRSR
jgi:Lon protease-like protein